jgi:hypothetical protein
VDCSLTEEQMEQKRAIRSYMLDGLAYMLNNDSTTSTTAETIKNSASLLQAIVSVPDEIPSSAITKANDVALQILNQAIQVNAFPIIDLLAVLSAADASLAASSSAPKIGSLFFNTTVQIAQAVTVVSKFGDLLLTQQQSGEDASRFIYNNFRMSSQAFTFIASPLTDLEKLKDVNASATVAASLNVSESVTQIPTSEVQHLQAIEVKQKFWRNNESVDRLQSNMQDCQCKLCHCYCSKTIRT